MAGYQGRSNTPAENEYINATAFNSQIVKQRVKLNESSPTTLQVSEEQLAERGGLGIAKSTTTFFDQFNANEIMQKANDFFGSIDYDQGDTNDETFNPDFAGSLDLRGFKTYDSIIGDARVSVAEDAPDQPGIGVGPNLLSPGTDEALNNAMGGSFENRDPFSPEMSANNRRRGYGWSKGQHGSTRIGNYLSDKYKFNSSDTVTGQDGDNVLTNTALQGENINTDAIAYRQPIDDV
tara:strand:- start:487 stop:1194 length:708 start_codon:yes stop_codon:yes gene_type:complete